MNSPIQNKIAILFVCAIVLMTTVACSSSSGGGGSAAATTSSATSSSGLSSSYNSSGLAITNCSQSNANIADLNMNLEQYSSGGVLNPNLIRVRFNAFPSNFVNLGSSIVFWAYGTDSSGNYTTMYQVPFTLEHYTGNATFSSISGNMQILTWQQLASFATSAGVSNVSATTALQNITFVIDINSIPNSTVLSAALYLNGPGTASAPVSPDRYLQALIPSFLANPNNYLSTHNSTLLSLHPFNAYASSGYSEAQYLTLGNSLCF